MSPAPTPDVGKWFARVPVAACCRILPVAGLSPYSLSFCPIVQTRSPARIGDPPPTLEVHGRCSDAPPVRLRTSFVCLMSHNGVSTEEISRLVGHTSTQTTEVVYRRELRPAITTGAEIMDKVFKAR